MQMELEVALGKVDLYARGGVGSCRPGLFRKTISLQRVSKRMEARLGLTIPQRLSLLLIGRNPGILASELASVLHLHRGTLSGVVRRLETAGFVTRTVDASDARRAGLTLTPAGQRVNRHRAGTFEEAVRRVLSSTLPSERAAAEHVLTRLGGELRATGDE